MKPQFMPQQPQYGNQLYSGYGQPQAHEQAGPPHGQPPQPGLPGNTHMGGVPPGPQQQPPQPPMTAMPPQPEMYSPLGGGPPQAAGPRLVQDQKSLVVIRNSQGPPTPGLPPQNGPQGTPLGVPASVPPHGGQQGLPPGSVPGIPHGVPQGGVPRAPPGILQSMPQGLPQGGPVGMPHGVPPSATGAANWNQLANQFAGMSFGPQPPISTAQPMGVGGRSGIKAGTYPLRPAYGGQGDTPSTPNGAAPPRHCPPQPQQPPYVNGQAGAQGPVGPGRALLHQPGPAPMPAQYPPQPQPQQNLPPMGYSQPYEHRDIREGGMSYPGQNMHLQQQQQPPPQEKRRLDPNNMPSLIQVMQDDQLKRSGVFANQTGELPPLVTTNFIAEDSGNCNPRFIRSSMYSVPVSSDTLKQTAVPFALIISPFARTAPEERPPPVVDFGATGPVRCHRCQAYMCPYMQFVDGGRRFLCPFCKATTEVPEAYFQHLDHTGQRVDRFQRPELLHGAYEIVATKEYCKDNVLPKPPAMIFLIDVSYNNIKNGMVKLLCAEMKRLVALLPADPVVSNRSNMRVGFITYNNTVHFYNIKGCLAQPQMMVVGDVQDMFMPLLDGFLCDVEESSAVIDALMEQIPAMFAETRETETVLAPAIQAGMEALRAAQCAGKLLVFHSSLPIAEAPGKLGNRDDRKLLGTDKQKTVLGQQNNIYFNLGQECVSAGCSVDLFVFNNAYVDLATIGQVARLTGGQIYKYTYFQADNDGDRLLTDLCNNISRPTGYDGVMRVRTSTGIRATDFYGHFYMSNTRDMEVGSIDADKAVAVEIKHDDKLSEADGVFIQVALLYTSCGGQRRLRILNLSLNACVQMADMFRSCDLDSFVNFISKQACFRLLESTPKQVKDNLINRAATLLACYRKNCSSSSPPGQLILPETMKLLPLALNCVLKSDAISGGPEMSIDDRSFLMQAVMTMDVPASVVYFYPRLIPIHSMQESSPKVPCPIRCSADNMASDGIYLLVNGIYMFMWVGLAANPDWVKAVFGVASVSQIDCTMTALPELNTPLSELIRDAIQFIREQQPRATRLTVLRQQDKMEIVMKQFLVEDGSLNGSLSYVDFLCHLHNQVRDLLN